MLNFYYIKRFIDIDPLGQKLKSNYCDNTSNPIHINLDYVC